MIDPQNPKDDDCELNYTKAPWIAEARHVASQLWCKHDTRHLVMNLALFEHIVQLVAGLKIEIAVAKAENFSAFLNSAESKEPLEIKLLPALTAEPVAFQIVKSELCYKSKSDDQSFGMWCPVNYDTDHGYEEGTKFYTHPAPALTAELKAELLECLNIGYSAQLMTVANSRMTDYKAGKLAEISSAITKLTNLESKS